MRMSDEDWDSVIDLDLRSIFLCTREAIRTMLASLDQAAGLLLEETATLLQARADANLRALLLWALCLSLAVALLVYLFVGFYLSVHGAIATLSSATRRMAEGDLRTRVETAARDELGDLAQDFNDMQARMSQLIAQVSQFSESTLGKAQNVSDSASTSQLSMRISLRS